MQNPKPEAIAIGEGEFDRIQIRPNAITMIGGAPAGGKSALLMQFVYEAVRLDPTLIVVVLSVEMSKEDLWARELSRRSRIPCDSMFYDLIVEPGETLTPEREDKIRRFREAVEELDELSKRVHFVDRTKPTTAELLKSVALHNPRLVVLDHIQVTKTDERYPDERTRIDAVLSVLRDIANENRAVIAASQLGRTKSESGSSGYVNSVGLGDLKGSGALESGAESVYILHPQSGSNNLVLEHLKFRHGKLCSPVLQFDGDCYSFRIERLLEGPQTIRPSSGSYPSGRNSFRESNKPNGRKTSRPANGEMTPVVTAQLERLKEKGVVVK